MALPFVFGTTPAGNVPASEIDTNLNSVGLMGTTACTASGTNAITLTPVANQPTVSSYTNQQKFTFTAVANSTASVTLQVNALGLLNLYLQDGVTQAASGNLTNTQLYSIIYLAALNSGSGGFQILNATGTGISTPVNVASGGTGNTSLTTYTLLAGGTTGTGAVQQVAGTGTSGQVLTSNGAGALPTFQAATASALSSSIKTFTRNQADPGGSVAYIGLGFRPTSCKFIYVVSSGGTNPIGAQGSVYGSGFADSSKNGQAAVVKFYTDNSITTMGTVGIWSRNANVAILGGDPATNVDPLSSSQTAVVASYDADGFTLTWSVNGSPGGTLNVSALCEK